MYWARRATRSKSMWAILVMVLMVATSGACALLALSGCRAPASPGPKIRPEATQPAQPGQGEPTTTVVDQVADVRREPEDGAELMTQVLFNEQVELLGDADGWFWVRAPDGGEGWMRRESLGTFLPDESPWSGVTGRVYASRPTVQLYTEPRGTSDPVKTVYLGTPLGVVEKEGAWLGVRLPGTGRGWVEAGDVTAVKGVPAPANPTEGILDTARSLLGTPYLWGGTSPRGYDCSGLIYEVYKVHGIKLPRDADQQFKVGRKIDRDSLAPGDLVFFSSGPAEPTHVVILAGQSEIIHAGRAGGVEIIPLSSMMARLKYLGARRVGP